MLHDFLIAVHTVGGAAAFLLGFFVIHPLCRGRRGVFLAYFVGLWVMALTLVPVVWLDWPHLSLASRITYVFLILLALYTGLRGELARRVRGADDVRGRYAYVDHVGFTLISLFDGFVIVSAIVLGVPGWLVGVAGALGVVVGVAALRRFQSMWAGGRAGAG